MNNSIAKTINIIAKVFAVVLIVSILGGIVEACFGIGKRVFDNDKKPSTSASQQIAEKQAISDKTKLVLDIKSTDVKITLGDAFSVDTNNDYIVVKEKDNCIEIKEKEHSIKDITSLNIVLPKDLVLSTFDFDAGAGNINIEKLNCEIADIDLGAGNVVIENIIVSVNADIDAGAGDVTIKNGEIRNLDYDMGMGETTIDAKIVGESSIDCGVGNLELGLLSSPDDYTLNIEKGLGTVFVANEKLNDDSILGSGSNKIKISGGLGNITVNYKN